MEKTRERITDGIALERETLTDGSHVYNIIVMADESAVRIGCVDRAHARKLADLLVDASFVEAC